MRFGFGSQLSLCGFWVGTEFGLLSLVASVFSTRSHLAGLLLIMIFLKVGSPHVALDGLSSV